MEKERCFYLGRLDAVAPDFDLIVYASEKLNIPVMKIAAQVSGPVKARLRALIKRM